MVVSLSHSVLLLLSSHYLASRLKYRGPEGTFDGELQTITMTEHAA
jgi:hypothetical protein